MGGGAFQYRYNDARLKPGVELDRSFTLIAGGLPLCAGEALCVGHTARPVSKGLRHYGAHGRCSVVRVLHARCARGLP